MNLFIVVVSFNCGEDLVKLVESLKYEKVSGWKMQMIVVENGLADSCLRSLRSLDPSTSLGMTTKIIKNKINLGFAKGANIGIKYALRNGADSILLLNQDTVVESGFIQPLVDNSADVVSPVIKFNRNEKWIYDYGGKVDWWWGRTRHIELTNYPITQLSNNPIDYVSGCCMLIKRQVFETIGLFDERFFLYFEDADYCIRAKKAGFTIAVEPRSMITHRLIEGRKKPFRQQLNLLTSNTIFITKYLRVRRPLGYLYLLVLAGKMLIEKILVRNQF